MNLSQLIRHHKDMTQKDAIKLNIRLLTPTSFLVSLVVFMLSLLTSILISITPVETATSSTEALELLWSQALQAEQAGNVQDQDRALWGWMTLKEEVRSIPEPFQAWTDRIQKRLETSGSVRIFAARLEDRIRLTVSDPAQILGRVQVYIKTQKGFRLLTRLDSHAVNRNEYGGIGALDTSARIMVQAYLRWPHDHLLARRIFLEGDNTALPGPQFEPRVAAACDGCQKTKPYTPYTGSIWWLVGLAVLSVGFAGGAIWQEQAWSP